MALTHLDQLMRQFGFGARRRNPEKYTHALSYLLGFVSVYEYIFLMNSAELVRHLKRHGARLVAQGKGSHQHWEREGRRTVVVIRGSNKRVGTGLVVKICKDLGIPPP